MPTNFNFALGWLWARLALCPPYGLPPLVFRLPKNLTLAAHFISDSPMKPLRSICVCVLAIAASAPASAQTVKFEDAAGLLGASCAKDIEANCRGVNLDTVRMKDCLYRNEDALSPQCKADYARALDAIQKRVAARAAVTKLCQRDTQQILRQRQGRSQPYHRLPVGGTARNDHQLQQGPHRSGVSLMRSGRMSRRDIGLFVVALLGFAARPARAQAAAGGTADE